MLSYLAILLVVGVAAIVLGMILCRPAVSRFLHDLMVLAAFLMVLMATSFVIWLYLTGP